jgi:putative oxidoreductase
MTVPDVDARGDQAPSRPWKSEDKMKRLIKVYVELSRMLSRLQSPFLPAIRLYWVWQFAEAGWGKMYNIAKISAFFTSLNIPFPAFNAHSLRDSNSSGGSC